MNESELPLFDERRSQAIERLLTDTVESTPRRRPRGLRRPGLALILGSIGVFALAGAVTGGAVASADSLNVWQAATDSALRELGQETIGSNSAIALGTPMSRSGTSTLIIRLGQAPSGATGVLVSFECVDPGTFEESVDGKDAGGDDCLKSAGGPGSSAAIDTVTGSGPHVLTVTDHDDARFSAWISWVKVPALEPSADENAETADGYATRAEELAAFDRYAVCRDALGYPVTDQNDMQSGMEPQTETTDDAVVSGADNRCWQTQFRAVDALWQNEVDAGTVGAASIDQCLSDAGVDPAKTPAARLKQLAGLNLDWQEDCTWVG